MNTRTAEPCNDYPVVALSCSAGGLDALTRVLVPLPAALPAAVLVVQHLPPGTSSQLPAVLSRPTALAVQWPGTATRCDRGPCWLPRPGSTR